MGKVTFDGASRRIIVNSGVSNVDVQTDIYSEWKIWVQTDSNAMYEQALRTFGGDPTVGGQTAPRYFFLLNGWRVVIDNQYVTFATNLYSEDGSSPFELINGGEALNKVSDSPSILIDGDGSLTQDEHDALMALSNEIFQNGQLILSEISNGETAMLQAILDGKDELLSSIDTSKAEIIAKLETENSALSTQLESVNSELNEKLNIITELSMNYKYKAFV
jgi:hypothetical protein